jgi:hypothetical protein
MRFFSRGVDSPTPPAINLADDVKRLIFGDSVFLRVSHKDKNRSPLMDMLSDEDNGKLDPTFVFAYSALTLPHYFLYLLLLGDRIHSLDKILIPINYRSFSCQWELNPAWQYRDHMTRLNDLLGSSKVDMNSIFSDKDYSSSIASYYFYGVKQSSYFLTELGRKSELLDAILERRRKIFAFNYLFDSATLVSSKRFAALDLICRTFQDISNKLYFVHLPVNVDGIDFLFGKDAKSYFSANLKIISDLLTMRKINLLDCSASINRFGFFNELEATEHLNETGRSQLRDHIKSFLR